MANQEMNRDILFRMVEDVPEIAEYDTLEEKCKKYLDALMNGRKITPVELKLILACTHSGVIESYEIQKEVFDRGN